MVSVALTEIVRPESMAAALNGVFWLALLLLPIANGMLLLRQVRQGESLHPLPLIAVFYALVSIHNQIPIYLWFSTGLSALAFLWLMAARHREVVGGAIVAVGAAIALYWHAGQPVERGFAGTLAGQRYEGPLAAAPEGATLRVTPEETRAYAALIDLIKHETSPGETILAIPNNPELYFLGGRRASVRFWNSAFGLRDDEHVAAAERMLATDPPRLVFHNPADKYNTPRSDRLMAAIKARYVYVGRVDDVDVYRRVNDVK
jgi:hypothetical protein